MRKSLLLYSHDFQINVKKLFKACDVHMLDINAEVLDNVTYKNYKLMSEVVKCLFEECDKLTLVTNFVPNSNHNFLSDERTFAFIFKTNDIKETYELNDFHAAVISHLTSHHLLLESQVFLKKELVSSELSKATNNLKTINSLLKDYDALISQSKCVLVSYREDFVLRFGFKT